MTTMNTSMPIYPAADIGRIEQAAGTVSPTLMERAGLAAAELARELIAEGSKDVLVLAGPGNNGGDAYEAAVHLKQWFYRVHLVSPADAAKLPPDAQRAHAKWLAAGGAVLAAAPEDLRWGLVIDGLFGSGRIRAVEAEYAGLVEIANSQSCPVLALDVPSGIDSDTGHIFGCAVRATHTLTFIAHKPGLLTLDGPDHCGELRVAGLGLDVKQLLRPRAWIVGPELFSAVLKPRRRNFHKGDAGSVAVLGGATGMTGAALLAARAALKLGGGRVYVGLLDTHAPHLDPLAPELMLRGPDEIFGLDLDALVVGPGLGQGERAETLLGVVLTEDMPCVLDADALNLLAENEDLQRVCARRGADTLITPHPGEAARLLGGTVSDVQKDRVAAAHALRDKFGSHVLLKGNGSVLAASDGHWFINTSGNPGMASAGMGDVLSGMLGSLLAQGYSGEAALVLGTHLHGCAGDALAASGIGPVGLTAGELIEPARRIWNGWLKPA
jgi:hydroxyethylthiazole kinase-like uncharacterized protein yjeF